MHENYKRSFIASSDIYDFESFQYIPLKAYTFTFISGLVKIILESRLRIFVKTKLYLSEHFFRVASLYDLKIDFVFYLRK